MKSVSSRASTRPAVRIPNAINVRETPTASAMGFNVQKVSPEHGPSVLSSKYCLCFGPVSDRF